MTGCAESGSGSGNLADKVENLPAGIAEKDPVKLMVVRKIGGDDHTAQFLAGAKQEGEALGFKVDTFSANGDSAKFHDAIAQAIDSDYDGFIISHGDDPASVQDVKKITEKEFRSSPSTPCRRSVTLQGDPDIAG